MICLKKEWFCLSISLCCKLLTCVASIGMSSVVSFPFGDSNPWIPSLCISSRKRITTVGTSRLDTAFHHASPTDDVSRRGVVLADVSTASCLPNIINLNCYIIYNETNGSNCSCFSMLFRYKSCRCPVLSMTTTEVI